MVLVLIIVGLALWVWYLLKSKKDGEAEVAALQKEKDELAGLGSGLEEYRNKLQEKKEQAKVKILELLNLKQKISHKDVAKELGASRTTVVRYLDDLEKEGKVRQVGGVGQGVFYTKSAE